MLNNTSIKELGGIFLGAESVVLFPHENPDGDALGSCVALCGALRQKGVNAWVLLGEELPQYISFLGNECCTTDQNCVAEPDVCACIDCGEDKRIPGRTDKFHSGRTLVCIDHHATAEPFGDKYYIDPDEAATAQIIYRIIDEAGIEIDREMANAMYTAISSDTGNFQYSNTTAETHRIAMELFKIGVDHNDIMVRLYQNVDRREMEVLSKAMNVMEIFAEGKAAITYVTREMLEECDASMEHAENVINSLRDIQGVEIAAILKEKDDQIVKASMRSKTTGNVGAIAKAFGGGGHIKAAGCTLNMGIEEALAAIKEEITKAL